MSPAAKDDWRLVFMPEDQVTSANGIVQVMRDRWFVVCPKRGLVFWQSVSRRNGQLRGASPQCNSDQEFVTMLRDKLYPWAEVRQFPLVLQSIHVGDYA